MYDHHRPGHSVDRTYVAIYRLSAVPVPLHLWSDTCRNLFNGLRVHPKSPKSSFVSGLLLGEKAYLSLTTWLMMHPE